MPSKKWLVAIYASKRERLMKVWRGQVSKNISADEVSLPDNTLFFFFSDTKEVDLEITQLRFSEKDVMVWLEEEKINECAQNRKIYTYGRREKNSLILNSSMGDIIIDNFFTSINMSVELL